MIIARYHDLERIEADLEFLTPTFLGGADQNARFRIPPFKALLRQWWRVANGNLEFDELRRREGDLFGTVLEAAGGPKASSLRINERAGSNIKYDSKSFDIGKTLHPEVGTGGGMRVDNSLYLGFGPVTYSQHALSVRPYILPGSVAKLTIDVPKSQALSILTVLDLINAFGSVGSRCRNGYGSLAVRVQDGRKPPSQCPENFELLVAGKKYPHGIGRDNTGLLVWEAPAKDWRVALELLAGAYLNLRVKVNIAPTGMQKRHIMGYPVTNHEFNEWGGRNGRMPSQIRLLVKKKTDGSLCARMMHLPHKLPKEWDTGRLGSEKDNWVAIHALIDELKDFKRMEAGS